MLCPKLKAILEPDHSRSASIVVVAAALSLGADVRVLRPGRFRLLHLAWVQGQSLAAIGRLTCVASPDAVRQRLLRVSAAIEKRLAAEAAAITADPARAYLRLVGEGRALRPDPEHVTCLRNDVLRALHTLAHG